MFGVQAAAAAAGGWLDVGEVQPAPGGGRKGLHSEHLGYLLAEMQVLAREYPGASW